MKGKGGGGGRKKIIFFTLDGNGGLDERWGGLVFSVEHIKKFFFTKEPFIRE